MDKQTKTKQLLKILFGAAWIDGVIQAQEREYLHNMAVNQGLENDPEIKPLLSEIKAVDAEQCYVWLEDYLGDNHAEEDYQDLMEKISGLIYSDGEVETQEAKLLTKLQLLDPANDEPKSVFDQILKAVQKVYRQAINQQL